MKKYIWIIGFLFLITCLPVFGQWDKTGGGGTGTVDNTPDNGGTDAAGEDWAYDHANGTSPHVAFNLISLLSTKTPQAKTYADNDDDNETIGTDFTSEVINITGDNDANNDSIDLQDGTVAGQQLIFNAYALIDSSDTFTIDVETDSTAVNMTDTSGLITFTDVGQWAWLEWNGAAWLKKWPITSMDIAVPVPNIADPDTWTLTTNYGHYTGSAAGAVSLVAPTIYDSIVFDTEGTGAMTINPAGTDHIWLNGTDCGESKGIVSGGTTGDTAAIKYRTSTTFSAKANGFTCVP